VLLVSAGLVFANAFFVASEFALVRMRPSRLEQLASGGHRRARAALRVSLRLDRYLAANQLGITLSSIALGWVGEPAFAALLLPLFAGMGAWSPIGAHALAAALSLALITLLHTVLGELVPKSIAMRRTEPVALWTAAPLRLFYVLLFPLIWALDGLSHLVLRSIGIRERSITESLHSPEELRILLRRAALEPGTKRAMDRLFDEDLSAARHAMTPREEIVALEVTASWGENLEIALGSPHVHYPLIERATERVLGCVRLKDIVGALGSDRAPRIGELVREPVYALADTPIEQLREALSRRGVHVALIVTPEGVLEGLVTLADLLEEADYGPRRPRAPLESATRVVKPSGTGARAAAG